MLSLRKVRTRRTPDEFILRRSGEWLSLSAFFQLLEPDRAEFVFRTAAGVMQLMNNLPPKVHILRTGQGKGHARPD
jgi:hypothetical protein